MKSKSKMRKKTNGRKRIMQFAGVALIKTNGQFMLLSQKLVEVREQVTLGVT